MMGNHAAPRDCVAAVVPAAGASRRFGGAKLLAQVDGEPLLQHTIRCLLDASIDPVVVVVPPHGAALRQTVALLDDRRVSVVVNAEPERGMFSSIQTGLGVVGEGASVVVLPGDMPFVRAATVAALVAAHRNEGTAVVATYRSKRGHPVLIPPAARGRLVAASPTISLKAAMAMVGVVPREVDLDDPGVVRDVDVKTDLP